MKHECNKNTVLSVTVPHGPHQSIAGSTLAQRPIHTRQSWSALKRTLKQNGMQEPGGVVDSDDQILSLCDGK